MDGHVTVSTSSFIRSIIASFNSTCSPHDQSTLFILILYGSVYSSTLPQSLEIEVFVIIFYIKSVIFLQLCYKTKDIEFLLPKNPCAERIRQEPPNVKFLTYQKTDDFGPNPVILEPTKGNICLVAALVYRKGKAYVSIRGVVEGEPPALGLVTG